MTEIAAQIAAQDAVDEMIAPVPPHGAFLTAARHVQPRDVITQGKGSRYKGPDFEVASRENFYAFFGTGMQTEIRGTKGERLAAVPAEAAYYVIRPQDAD